MDQYDPQTVFSSIDRNGRYAYTNQPAIAQWNLARLGESLLPLIHPDREKAIELARGVLDPFIGQFDARILSGMCRKIGLAAPADGDAALIRALLTTMQQSQADFTLTFRLLARAAEEPAEESELRKLFSPRAAIDAWLHDWRERVAHDPQSSADRASRMRTANPAFIPRNHRVEAALKAAERGDYSLFHRILTVLSHPYDEQPAMAELAQPPEPSERVLQTFCGT